MAGAVICLAGTLTLAACAGEPADTVHGKQYRNDMLAFTYPGNWQIVDEQFLDYPYYTSIENKGNAVTIVFTVEAADDIGLRGFIARYIDFYRSEMDKKHAMEAGPATFGPVTTFKDAESVTERFTLKGTTATSPHTRYYRRKASADYVCYVVSQTPDAELHLVSAGFDQIVETLAVARKQAHGVD